MKKLNNEPFAMIAHIIYKQIDSLLAPTSKVIIEKIRTKGSSKSM